MGDHADDASFDEMMDFEYSHGGGEYGGFVRRKKEPKTCNRCGKTGLRWFKNKDGDWRLFDKGKLHVCGGDSDWMLAVVKKAAK